ncbi:MAG: citrate lyase ACP, partial [Calditrichia bacterium]|nr:citrate lyase ACP [Calditrichia bacterium]
MSNKFAESGNRGPKVKSDCWVGLKINDSGGIKLNLKSKVEPFYGDSIRKLFNEMLGFFEIKNAEVEIEDKGAVPFVLMARFESAVKKLRADNGKRYLPAWDYEIPPSAKDRFRRSRLYLPGDQPKLMLNAAIHSPDGLILDLEDSVAASKKTDARFLIRNALRGLDFMGSERMVRINQLPLGYDDLKEIIPEKVDLILIPKVEKPEQLVEIDKKVDAILKENKIERDVYYMPIIESALGVINAYPIAAASKRNVALAIGLEDYTADIGTQRTNE